MRIDLALSAHRYLQGKAGPDSPVTRNTGEWTWHHPRDNWSQLVFEAIPPVHEAQVVPELIHYGMMGVYWLCNHCDNEGMLSCGQIYDLMCSLVTLESYIKPVWPRGIFGSVMSLLRACNERTSALYMSSREPSKPKPPREKQPPPRTAPAPFAYAEEEPPVAANFDLETLKKLSASLKPLPQPEPYDPSAPFFSSTRIAPAADRK